MNYEIDSSYNLLAQALRLAGDDPTKLNEVYEMNYLMALDILMYWKQRDKFNYELQKAYDRKNNLK